MKRLLKQFITFPESPLRLLAAWFLGSAVFAALRPHLLMPLWMAAALIAGLFFIFTLLQHFLPFPRFSTLTLALSTVTYAVAVAATRAQGQNLVLTTIILFAVAVILFPLVTREEHALLPFAVSKKLGITLCVIAAVFCAFMIGTITCLRYLTFSSPNYDFGIFCNMFHNMSTTGLPTTSSERETIISHFAVHISPVYYLILPFYMLFPSPLTLQIAQAVALASCILPLYLLARHYKLSHAVTAALAALYALYPAVSTGTFYDLHENCFLPTLLLWLFLLYEKKRWLAMTIAAVLVLSVKEDAAGYVVFFAIYVLLARRDWRRGIPLIVGAVAYFTVAVYILKQYGTGAMFGRYEEVLGGNAELGGLVGTLLRDPLYFLELITTPDHVNGKLKWLYIMLLPLGALLWMPHRRYGRLLLLLPMFLNLLTQYLYQYNVEFQYSFGILPFLFYLLVQNAADAKPRTRRKHLVFSVVTALLLYVVLVMPSFAHYTKAYIEKYDHYQQIEAVLDTVPDNVSVTTSAMYHPHLAQRAIVYEDFYHTATDTDYAVLDMRPSMEEQSIPFLHNFLEAGYVVVREEPGIAVILKSPTAP